ncbi:hypothetical protein AB0B66_39335 [Catellatospora sp. NPDC049111]|uniref:TolB family protein n=1 Tax=Catellatospora sp. NPDC049111 TaxID=3155271 RepID=UPI0033EE7759
MTSRPRHTGRKTIIGALLSAAAAATALSGCGAPPPGATPAPAGPTPSLSTLGETPQQLAGGWQVVAAGDRVLDRTRNAYVALTMPRGGVIDPTGSRYATDSGQLSIVEVAGGKTTKVDRVVRLGSPVDPWSADGARLVATINRKDPYAVGFAVIDAATGKFTEHWLDRTKYDCSNCAFVFTRDGKEVAMAIPDRSQGEAAELVRSVQLFDAGTGEPTRSLPVKAMPQSPFAWSPDGRQIVANPDILKEGDQVLVDTTTGEARPFPYPAVWATADTLLAKFDDGVLTLRPDGTVVADASLAAPLSAPLVLGPPAS